MAVKISQLISPEMKDLRKKVLDLADAFNRANDEGSIPPAYQTPDIHTITYAFGTVLGEPFKAMSGTVVNTYHKRADFPGIQEGRFFSKPKKDPGSAFVLREGGYIDQWQLVAYHSWLCVFGDDQLWIQLRPHGALADLLSPSMSRKHPDREAYEQVRLDDVLVPDNKCVNEFVGLLRALKISK